MIFGAGVIVSFLVYIAIGLVVGSRVRDKADYYVAARNAPVLLITGSLVASYLSTVGFMGEVGFAYEGYPMLLLTMAAINAAGYVVGVVFFGRYLRRSRAMTVPDFFGQRFNSRAVQAAAGVTVVIGVGFYLVAVTQGVSLLLADLFGIGFGTALLIFWVAFTSFTFFAGSPGVLLTDTVMFCLFAVAGVLGFSYLVGSAGGPFETASALLDIEGREGMLSWGGVTGAEAEYATAAEGIFLWIVLGLVWGMIVATSPWQCSRYLMAKDEQVCLRAGFSSMVAILVLYVFLALGGAAVNIFDPNVEPTELAFVWAAQNVLPTWLGVIILTGITAAGLSSASTFLSLIGFSTAHDVAPAVRGGREPQERTSERERSGVGVEVRAGLRFTRTVMLVAALVVLVVTYSSPPAVLEIGYFAATLFAAAWGPLAFMSVFHRRITKTGALWGLSTGFVTVFVLEALQTFAGLELPVYLHPVIVGWALSLLAIHVADLGRQPDAHEREFRETLLRVTPDESRPGEQQRTVRYGVVAGASCLVVMAFLFVVYVLPLTRALDAG